MLSALFLALALSLSFGGVVLLAFPAGEVPTAHAKADPSLAAALLPAVREVERPISSEAAVAAFKRERASGDLQIRPCMIAEVNRIVGYRKFSHTVSPHVEAEAAEIFRVYTEHWAKATGDWSAEGCARRWNGGPSGHKKTITRAYWAKVKVELHKQKAAKGGHK